MCESAPGLGVGRFVRVGDDLGVVIALLEQDLTEGYPVPEDLFSRVLDGLIDRADREIRHEQDSRYLLGKRHF